MKQFNKKTIVVLINKSQLYVLKLISPKDIIYYDIMYIFNVLFVSPKIKFEVRLII